MDIQDPAGAPVDYDLSPYYPRRPRGGWKYGSCGPVVAEIVAKALAAGQREFKVVDGMVLPPGEPNPVPHTWIEHPGGIIDPTREQFPPGDLVYAPEGEYRDEWEPEEFLANQYARQDYARHAHRAPVGGAAHQNRLYRGGRFVPAPEQAPDAAPLTYAPGDQDPTGAALYGPAEDRAGFEAAIAENPLEATNHAVFGDWLEEQGEADEAAFRRALGGWLSGQNEQVAWAGGVWGFPPGPGNSPAWAHNPNAGWPWQVDRNHTPLGISAEDVATAGYVMNSGSGDEFLHMNPNDILPHHAFNTDNGLRLLWRDYLGMEEAFRRAFHANLARRRAAGEAV